MSKSKKNAKNSAQNNTQNTANNMSYATDKKSENTTDCKENRSFGKGDSPARGNVRNADKRVCCLR